MTEVLGSTTGTPPGFRIEPAITHAHIYIIYNIKITSGACVMTHITSRVVCIDDPASYETQFSGSTTWTPRGITHALAHICMIYNTNITT
jgi:hypothetical protein